MSTDFMIAEPFADLPDFEKVIRKAPPPPPPSVDFETILAELFSPSNILLVGTKRPFENSCLDDDDDDEPPAKMPAPDLGDDMMTELFGDKCDAEFVFERPTKEEVAEVFEALVPIQCDLADAPEDGRTLVCDDESDLDDDDDDIFICISDSDDDDDDGLNDISTDELYERCVEIMEQRRKYIAVPEPTPENRERIWLMLAFLALDDQNAVTCPSCYDNNTSATEIIGCDICQHAICRSCTVHTTVGDRLTSKLCRECSTRKRNFPDTRTRRTRRRR